MFKRELFVRIDMNNKKLMNWGNSSTALLQKYI